MVGPPARVGNGPDAVSSGARHPCQRVGDSVVSESLGAAR